MSILRGGRGRCVRLLEVVSSSLSDPKFFLSPFGETAIARLVE